MNYTQRESTAVDVGMLRFERAIDALLPRIFTSRGLAQQAAADALAREFQIVLRAAYRAGKRDQRLEDIAAKERRMK
jgi:hypothetical protein